MPNQYTAPSVVLLSNISVLIVFTRGVNYSEVD